MNYNETVSRELGWDDEIQYVNDPYRVLSEGDYHFVVGKFDRARHNGSEKIPACNKVILHLDVSNGEDTGAVQTTLYMRTDRNTAWKLSKFFAAIGQLKKGESLKPNWGALVGSSGTCHVGIRKWTGNDGKEREANEVTMFYEPDEAPAVAVNQAPQAPGAGWTEMPQGTSTPWETGVF